MTTFLAWLASFLEGLLVPLIEKWIAKTEVQKTVNGNQAQVNALIEAVAKLQTAKTPQDFIDGIKAVGAADNSNSK